MNCPTWTSQEWSYSQGWPQMPANAWSWLITGLQAQSRPGAHVPISREIFLTGLRWLQPVDKELLFETVINRRQVKIQMGSRQAEIQGQARNDQPDFPPDQLPC